MMKAALTLVLLLILVVLAALVHGVSRAAARAGRGVSGGRGPQGAPSQRNKARGAETLARGAQGGAPRSALPSAKSPGAPAGEPGASLRWPTGACIPRPAVEDCMRGVAGVRKAARAAPGGFGPAPARELAELAALAQRLAAKHRAPITEAFVTALRDLAVNQEIRRSGVMALRHGEKIRALHGGGETICAIAARLRLPPMATLRQLLAEGGRSPGEIRALVARPDGLPAALRAELPQIQATDLGSRAQGLRTKSRSMAFEADVGAYLRAQGVGFATEEDLRREHDEHPDRPLLTPDFLLSAPVDCAGRRIHWLDAKNYPAVDAPLVATSTARQVARYTAAFGPGALVFNGGVMCGTALEAAPPGVLVLDGTAVAKSRPAA